MNGADDRDLLRKAKTALKENRATMWQKAMELEQGIANVVGINNEGQLTTVQEDTVTDMQTAMTAEDSSTILMRGFAVKWARAKLPSSVVGDSAILLILPAEDDPIMKMAIDTLIPMVAAQLEQQWNDDPAIKQEVKDR